MRKLLKVLWLPLLFGLVIGGGFIDGKDVHAGEPMRIAYIEASIGKKWNLDKLPQRVGDSSVQIDFFPLYEFDKSPVLDKILGKPEKKPDAIVLQQCSVYFPGPLSSYKKQYKSWLKRIEYAGIQPVIATTVPPAEDHGIVRKLKDFIKEKILGRDNRYRQVTDFNDWLRMLAKTEGFVLLDLEARLRINETDRHMQERFNSGDYVHLNDLAYIELDQVVSNWLKNREGSAKK